MATISGECVIGCEIGVKRLTLPGVVIKDACPKCQKEAVVDLSKTCLYYPVLNDVTLVPFYCECESEWTVPVVLSLGMRLFGG